MENLNYWIWEVKIINYIFLFAYIYIKAEKDIHASKKKGETHRIRKVGRIWKNYFNINLIKLKITIKPIYIRFQPYQ